MDGEAGQDGNYMQSHRGNFFEKGLWRARRTEHAGDQAKNADRGEVHHPCNEPHHAGIEAFEEVGGGPPFVTERRKGNAESNRPDYQRQQVGFRCGGDQVRRHHRQQNIANSLILCGTQQIVRLFESCGRYTDAGLNQVDHYQTNQYGNGNGDQVIGDRHCAHPAEMAHIAE